MFPTKWDAAGSARVVRRRCLAHITGGTVIPMAARTRISSRRTTATVDSRNFLPALIRFAQDRIAVIEGVEKLRQLEGVLGEISRFGGRDALAHDIRSFRGRQPEFPDVVARLAIEILSKILRRDEVASSPLAPRRCSETEREAASRVSTETLRIDPPSRKMLEARTTAYCRGTLSP